MTTRDDRWTYHSLIAAGFYRSWLMLYILVTWPTMQQTACCRKACSRVCKFPKNLSCQKILSFVCEGLVCENKWQMSNYLQEFVNWSECKISNQKTRNVFIHVRMECFHSKIFVLPLKMFIVSLLFFHFFGSYCKQIATGYFTEGKIEFEQKQNI